MEFVTQRRDAVTTKAGRKTQGGGGEPRLHDIMSKDVVTAQPADTVLAAVQRMAETGVSCVVVVDGERVLGILTERDVLGAVARPETDLAQVTVAQAMSSPVHTAPATLSVLAAGRIMQARQIRRLPVLEGRHLAGIVTQTDITRGLINLTPLTSISDIMTREVVTIEAEALVAEAARVMASKRISCLVATRHGAAAGILTEKDLIHRVVTARRDPTQTRISDVMSSPVVTVPSTYSVLGVSRKMDALHLHRLVVMNEGTLCGIITQTDIMRAVRIQLERVENERWGWMTELATLVQCSLQDLQKLEEFLQKLNGTSVGLLNSAEVKRIPSDGQEEAPANTVA